MIGVNSERAIRNLAVGVPVRGTKILVQVARDSVKEEYFHRAVGGGIEFGESSEIALRREFQEELDVELGAVELLGVIENIFEYEGEPGHEIVYVYSVESEDLDAVSLDAELVILDEGSPVRWVELADSLPLYPEGTRELVESMPTK